MGHFVEFTLPKSENEVEILNRCLSILIQKSQLLDKEIVSFCNNDEALFKRIKNCLLETGAAKESPNFTIRILPTEYASKYLDTDYYNSIYKENVLEKEKRELEIIKIKKDLSNIKGQQWLSIIAIIISVITLIKDLL